VRQAVAEVVPALKELTVRHKLQEQAAKVYNLIFQEH
jgi:hypothetical protein